MAQAQYIQQGQAVDALASDGDVDAGAIVVVGDVIGISKLDVASGDLGALALEGVYDVVRADTIAFTAGDAVYWDADGDPDQGEAGTGAATDITGDDENLLLGYALADVADLPANLTVRVRKVNNGQAPVAANVADSAAVDVAALVVDINQLQDSLKAAGLMVADA